MEISQGNSLCSSLYHKTSKNVIFPFFFLLKLSEQESRKGPAHGRDLYQWEGGGARERGGG
jgi:hypothetical protein